MVTLKCLIGVSALVILLPLRLTRYARHDLYLPSTPASLQTLGRVECAVAGAAAPPDFRTTSPLILT